MPRPLYHHAIGLHDLRRVPADGVMVPDPSLSDPDYLPAYRWAEREVGFFPLFLAVGRRVEDVRMTGYQDHWAPPDLPQLPAEPGDEAADRRLVLFSFDHVDGAFSDYMAWHLVLNAGKDDYRLTPRETAMVLRRSWPASRWRRAAEHGPHSVQLLAPRLDLRRAVRVWVPDDATRREVGRLGHASARVRRIAYMGR